MLNELVIRALANKVAKGFPLDLNVDIENMHSELNELLEASPENRGEEIADIIIYCCGIAGYLKLDLEKIVLDKMSKIERRQITYIDGKFHKVEGRVL